MNISILMILLLLLPMADTDKKEKHWSSYEKLTWDDFQGRPERNTRHKASTACEMVIKLETNEEEAIIQVYCFFDKKKSWTKVENDDYLLNHEQRHFDLYEVYTRKMRKAISAITEKDPHNISDIVSKTYDEYFLECSNMQALYDRETKHSINKEKQSEWDNKIDALIEETSGLNDREISLPVVYK